MMHQMEMHQNNQNNFEIEKKKVEDYTTGLKRLIIMLDSITQYGIHIKIDSRSLVQYKYYINRHIFFNLFG